MLLFLLACAGASDTSAPTDSADPADSAAAATCDTGPDADWANFGEGFFTTYCLACHSSTAPDRHSAPESVNFDTEAEVRALADRVQARVIDLGTMPIGGGVSVDDLVLLQRYLDCGQ